jgi:hypothetical protein
MVPILKVVNHLVYTFSLELFKTDVLPFSANAFRRRQMVIAI